MFLVAVGFWNFLGAGVFGFLLNLPIISYYQIGTALTSNHAHGAMMGVYGMMGVGLALFALRYLIPPERWPDKFAKLSFWSLNIGLAWMMFATLLPLGVVQLYHSVNEGYYEARTLAFITQPGNATLEWLRLPGDVIFIVGGVLPFLWIAWLGVRYTKKATTHEVPIEALYTELEPVAAVPGVPGESRYGSDARADELDKRAADQSQWRSQRGGSDGPITPGDGPGTPRRTRRWRR